MLVTMTCSCGADLQLDIAHNDTLVMAWAQRFSDAHQGCGYMSPMVTDKPETTRKITPKAQPKREEW